MPRITEIYAYISVDDADDEGIIAARNPVDGSWMPMIAADQARIKALKSLAQRIAKMTNKPVKLVKFTVREEVETIEAPVEISVT